MITTRRRILGLIAPAALRAASLPEQSAAIILEHSFPDIAVSYLAADFRSGREIASRWPRSHDAAPLGSLVKPFTALAYAETYGFRFPIVTCDAQSHCWLPQGHGRMNLVSAIAHSCNAYFLNLARTVDPEALALVAQRYDLNPPPAQAAPQTLIGLGFEWQNSPLAMAHAYSELAARASDPGVRSILDGMLLSAREGTGRGVGAGAYVKTGTAPCIHRPRQMGDGYVIALYPAAEPRYNLLVRVHGVPGARAAWTCGKLRRALV